MNWLSVAGTAFSLFGTGTKLAIAGAAIVALLAAYGVWHHTVWERGYDRAIADIADQNDKAMRRASARRGVLLDCKSRDGMRWDQSTGQCVGR